MAQVVFGQYIMYGSFYYINWFFVQYFFSCVGFLAVGVIGVVLVFFLVQFVVGKLDFVCVDNNDVIVCIYVWCVGRFMFFMENRSNFGIYMANYFVFSVDDVLFVFYCFFFCRLCFIIQCIYFLNNLIVD